LDESLVIERRPWSALAEFIDFERKSGEGIGVFVRGCVGNELRPRRILFVRPALDKPAGLKQDSKATRCNYGTLLDESDEWSRNTSDSIRGSFDRVSKMTERRGKKLRLETFDTIRDTNRWQAGNADNCIQQTFEPFSKRISKTESRPVQHETAKTRT
jgi:hypothetical protein